MPKKKPPKSAFESYFRAMQNDVWIEKGFPDNSYFYDSKPNRRNGAPNLMKKAIDNGFIDCSPYDAQTDYSTDPSKKSSYRIIKQLEALNNSPQQLMSLGLSVQQKFRPYGTYLYCNFLGEIKFSKLLKWIKDGSVTLVEDDLNYYGTFIGKANGQSGNAMFTGIIYTLEYKDDLNRYIRVKSYTKDNGTEVDLTTEIRIEPIQSGGSTVYDSVKLTVDGNNVSHPLTTISAQSTIPNPIAINKLINQNVNYPDKELFIFYTRLVEEIAKAANYKVSKMGNSSKANNNNDQNDSENSTNSGVNNMIKTSKYAKNIILYGPPGTGKTYNTVERALEIIGGNYYSDRNNQKDRYNNLVKDGQIQFITFHQSYSYEEFIEGIRPKVVNNNQQSTSGNVEYEQKDGVFKEFCKKADPSCIKENNNKNIETAEECVEECNKEKKNYVFIIDEINRGNISKIFGELITLIEESKRLGSDDETWATLPYSGEKFCVPGNVYIIGTMNTADRSITALDTALRRRFTFEEMMPDLEVIKNVTINGIDVKKMLETMNERITVLYDREHTIGHAYFTKLNDNPSFDLLRDIMKDKIIPLLQEYFYDDYAKIRLVLADNQKDKDFQFITNSISKKADLFGNSETDDLEDTVVYSINKTAFDKPESYIGIYEPSQAKTNATNAPTNNTATQATPPATPNGTTPSATPNGGAGNATTNNSNGGNQP